MRLIIEIPEKAKQAFDCAEGDDMKGSFYDHGGVIGNAIRNGTPIPNNATNGTAVETVFPDIEITEVDTYTGIVSVELDWWNAPCKGENNAE